MLLNILYGMAVIAFAVLIYAVFSLVGLLIPSENDWIEILEIIYSLFLFISLAYFLGYIVNLFI